MSEVTGYRIKVPNWRAAVQRNRRRTRWVIGIFLGFYWLLGLLIDTYLYSNHYPTVKVMTLFSDVLTWRLMPMAAFVTAGIALIALLITYTFYDKIMLLGTNYREITLASAQNAAEKQLYAIVAELKIAAGFTTLPKVYLICAEYMNAFASGYSEKSAMVAITQGLLHKLDRSELQAVMAHEMSHIRHGDIKLTLLASVLSNFLLIAVDILFYQILSNRDRRNNGLVNVIIILRYLLPITTLLLTLYLSRTREYLADAGCVELTRDNIPLARALLKIHQDYQINIERYTQQYQQTAHEEVRRSAYLYDLRASGLHTMQSLANLFSTHPDIKSRLAALGVEYPNAS